MKPLANLDLYEAIQHEKRGAPNVVVTDLKLEDPGGSLVATAHVSISSDTLTVTVNPARLLRNDHGTVYAAVPTVPSQHGSTTYRLIEFHDQVWRRVSRALIDAYDDARFVAGNGGAP